MGLVYRNGRPYLYRSVRRGGKVTSEYVASGEAALLIHRMETVERDKRDDETWRRRNECGELEEVERGLNDLCKRAQMLAAEALTAAGFHQHHRGEWRMRRGERDRETEADVSGDGPTGFHPPR